MKRITFIKTTKSVFIETFHFIELKTFKIWLAIISCFFFSAVTSYSQKENKNNPYIAKAELLKYTNSDSSIYYYKKSIALNKEDKDTLNTINNLHDLSDLYAHILDYGNSYDGYWEALILAEKSKDDFSKARIYQALGWLYSFYDRDDEALQYFNNSLKLAKTNKSKNRIKSLEFILSDYFSILNLYRVKGEFTLAKKYLDSCNFTQKNINNTHKGYFVIAEAGYLDAIDKNYDSALTKLQEANDHFKVKDPSYLIIINYLLGDVYRMKGDLPNSILYFEKSLDFSLKYTSHANYKIMTHEALSEVYASINNYQKAYQHAILGKNLYTKVFGKNSKNSQHLFEINDKYRMQKEKEKEILNRQRIRELENEENVWLLKSILFSIIIFFIVLFGIVYVKNMRSNHIAEKKALAEKQKMKLQKNKEILELKNKELTTSALQLIEKDTFIEKIKTNITDNKESVDVRIINKMLKSIQGSPSSNWKEFEARFTAVNQSFYTNLKEKYPDLGQTDLKICALVKLNFSSKDMASLLGISFESVHTSRYRLRKKFNLDRNANLNEFINSI